MITLQPTATMVTGFLQRLVATCSLGGTISWSSSNTSRATITNSGLVNPILDGIVTITATSSAGGFAECILTIEGIDTTKVAQVLGFASDDVRTLCLSGKVNKFSKNLPIRDANLIGPADANNTTFFKKNYGGMSPSAWEPIDTLTTFLEQIKTATDNWPYLTLRETDPARIDDFRGHTIQKNACQLAKVNSGNSSLFYSWNKTTSQETIDRQNWDKFILEKLDNPAIKQISDFWLDASGTNNLSNYYLTVIFKNPKDSKYYIKSFGKMSTLYISAINLNITLEDFFANETPYYSDRIDAERWYMLTANNLAKQEITAAQMSETRTNSTLGTGDTYQLPICLKNGNAVFYVKNTIAVRTYFKMTLYNQRDSARTYVLGLYQTTLGVRTLVFTQMVTLLSGANDLLVFNGVRAGTDYYDLQVLSGFSSDDSLMLESDPEHEGYDHIRRVNNLNQLIMPLVNIYIANENDWKNKVISMYIRQEEHPIRFTNQTGETITLAISWKNENYLTIIANGDTPTISQVPFNYGVLYTCRVSLSSPTSLKVKDMSGDFVDINKESVYYDNGLFDENITDFIKGQFTDTGCFFNFYFDGDSTNLQMIPEFKIYK